MPLVEKNNFTLYLNGVVFEELIMFINTGKICKRFGPETGFLLRHWIDKTSQTPEQHFKPDLCYSKMIITTRTDQPNWQLNGRNHILVNVKKARMICALLSWSNVHDCKGATDNLRRV